MAPARKSKKTMGPEFGRNNYLFLGIGIFLVIVGFIFLGTGDITIAPILLVLGYCVAIPIGILLQPKKDEKADSPVSSEGRS
jgi:xanthine/uracil permease